MTTIVFQIVFFLLIIGVIYFMFKAGTKWRMVKVTHWLLFTYVAILLLAMVLVPFVSDKAQSLEGVQKVNEEGAMAETYTKLRNGEIDQINPKNLVGENHFDYQNQTLRIESSNENTPQIFVERKTTEDGGIDAFVYSTGFLIDGYDFSDKLKSYILELADDTLTLHSPGQQNIDISITNAPFPVRQFTSESSLHSSFSGGDQIIYLRIPKDVEVVNDERVYLEYVGK